MTEKRRKQKLIPLSHPSTKLLYYSFVARSSRHLSRVVSSILFSYFLSFFSSSSSPLILYSARQRNANLPATTTECQSQRQQNTKAMVDRKKKQRKLSSRDEIL
jgi:hypothetical protein